MNVMSANELNNALAIRLVPILDNVMDRLLEELILIIDRNVYSHQPSEYTRTNDVNSFKYAWGKTTPIAKWGVIESMIEYDGSKLSHDPHRMAHGAFNDNLVGDGLAEIIETGNIGNIFGQPLMWTNPLGARPYWGEFQTYVVQNIDRIFKEECLRGGLDIVGRASVM